MLSEKDFSFRNGEFSLQNGIYFIFLNYCFRSLFFKIKISFDHVLNNNLVQFHIILKLRHRQISYDRNII